MKRSSRPYGKLTWVVAPCAGAWIETQPSAVGSWGICVAPCAGAWIETNLESLCAQCHARSPPARGRGLKHIGLVRLADIRLVAPCAGAWIETGMRLG